jgi:4-hydroxy-tetrahydrodipicolinate reductase
MGRRLCALVRDDERFDLVSGLDRRSDAGFAPSDLDVIVDFSSDEGARRSLEIARSKGAAALIGTTGLSGQTLDAAGESARSIPVMIAPNTSRGVAVLKHLVREATRLLGDAYDVDVIEQHHGRKRDAPSGTALALVESIEQSGLALAPHQIHSIRAGGIVGEHLVQFVSSHERIELAHVAISRDLFASGALDAAAWLARRSAGLYGIEDALGLSTISALRRRDDPQASG